MPDEDTDDADDFESEDRATLSRILREHGTDDVMAWIVADVADQFVRDDGFTPGFAVRAAKQLLGVTVE